MRATLVPRLPACLIAALAATGTARLRAEESSLDAPHRALYEKVRPSIVGIRARGTLGEVSGSGILLDAQGTILTSSSVVGRGAEGIRVWLAGPRLATARLIGVRPEDECALLHVDAADLKPIAMGDSDAVAVGRRVYSIGNAENALINDDQASLSLGVVSGLYGLREERMGSSYTGRVLETTAAVNPGIEGGALLDEQGRLVGMVVLNYSPLRWLGVAVPINALKPAIESLQREDAAAGGATEPEAPRGEGWFGAEVEAAEGVEGLRVKSVAPDGPADAAGLAAGHRILELAGKKVMSPEAFDTTIRSEAPGTLIWIKVNLGDEERECRVTLGAKPGKK